MKRLDMSGLIFGHLRVISLSELRLWGQKVWNCKCECGTYVTVCSADLRKGHTKSCGCKKSAMCKTANMVHGASSRLDKWPEYRIWGEMIQRCENTKSNRYYSHGARGIMVCKRWRKSFTAFINDMGRRPAKGLSLERRNNDGHYKKSNCYWATKKQQSRNKRNNRLVTLDGVTRTIAEWAELTGIKSGTIRARLDAGKAPSDALEPMAPLN